MDHSTKLQEFSDLLTAEIKVGLRHIADIRWETHTAMVLYCADLADMALAANSIEQIDSTGCHPLISTDWQRIVGGSNLADYLNSWQDDWMDNDCGETFDWNAEIVRSTITSIKSAQQLGIHNAENFSSQFLWGLQFTDPSHEQIDTMLSVSGAVNTASIHNQFERALCADEE